MSKTPTDFDRAELAHVTFRNDCRKSPFQGVVEAGWQSFVILIAIEVFAASPTLKAVMAGSHFIGLLATPVTLSLVRNSRIPVTRLAALYFGLAAVLIGCAALATDAGWFALFMTTGLILAVQGVPLLTQMYSNNYSRNERGKRVSTALMISALAGIVFSQAGGALLDVDMGYWPWVFVVMALSAASAAFFIGRIPSEPLKSGTIGNPWQNISLAWKDSLFGYLLLAWMLMGFGNLITMPLRVEYLANERYGIDASPLEVTLVAFVLMQATRVVSMKIWGRFFDRVHFIPWRIAINACFLIGILVYFTSTHLWAIGIGSLFIGLGFGGGNLAWNLWITKLAPPEKVGAYMSVHTGMTGLRGSMAPFAGYAIIEMGSPALVGVTSAVLIGISMVLFAAVRRHERLR